MPLSKSWSEYSLWSESERSGSKPLGFHSPLSLPGTWSMSNSEYQLPYPKEGNNSANLR